MRKWLIIIGVLIALAAIVTWRAPANLLLQPAQARLPQVNWSDVSGTAWDGTVHDFSYKGIQLGELDWQFDGLEDIASRTTRWNIHSRSPQHDIRATLTLTPDGFLQRAADVRGQLPASWIDITDRLPLLYLQGLVELDVDHIDLDQNLPVNGAGQITWSQAAISGGANEQFGKLRLDLEPTIPEQPNGLAFDIRSMEPADISLQGTGHLLRSEYNIDLKLEIALEREDLLQFMQQIGGETRPGLYRFAWQGQIR